jgi:nucleotidyltransferase substrate binding protein (TIGR01987 family)
MAPEDLDLTQLRKALATLRAAWDLLKATDDENLKEVAMDSCVKRFEYTVETAWKTMRRFLKWTYGRTDRELTVHNIFRLMGGYGFVRDWESWRRHYAHRNDTAHKYSVEKAQELVATIPDLVTDTEELLRNLEAALGKVS